MALAISLCLLRARIGIGGGEDMAPWVGEGLVDFRAMSSPRVTMPQRREGWNSA